MLPGVVATLSAGVTGIQYEPIGSSGQPVEIKDNSLLGITFASAGEFSGTLTISGAEPIGDPVTTPTALTVSSGSAATPISIPMPTDSAFTNSNDLNVSVLSLPSNGIVSLSGGSTPVTVGEELTVAQLTTLTFEPTQGLSADSSVFSYDIADPDDASTTGTVTLAIAGTGPSPVVDSLSAVTDSGAVLIDAGHVVTITMSASTPLTVTGTPQLQLSDDEAATYTSGNGTDTLTFTYTVQPGDSSSDLGVSGLELTSGAAIQSSGNELSTSLSADFGIAIDTTAPTVSSISAATNTGASTVGTGDAVTITLTMTEAVIIQGMPTLQLNDGEVADYSGGYGTDALTFTYSVEPGDSSTDLQVTGLNLPGARRSKILPATTFWAG